MTASPPSAPFVIRPATPDDCAALAGMIHSLADYERLAHACRADADTLRAHLFGPRPACEAMMALADGEPAGFALYFQNFSTFECRPGLYLEDLFVEPRFRGRGIGAALLRHLARVAADRGYARMEWAVLTWNELAATQYRKIGAAPLDDWRIWRMNEEAIRRLAAS